MKKLILVLVGALCITAMAQPGGGKSFEKHSAKMAERLQLTEDQRQDFDAILENHHQQMRQFKDEKRSLSREERKAARESFRAQRDEMYQQVRAELSGILSAEQLSTFDEIHAERRARHEAHRKMRHEHKRGDKTDTL